MALSMQWWPGTQQPRSWLFAAFTMASTASVVMSPRQRRRRGLLGDGAASSSVLMPASAIIPCSSSSCVESHPVAAGVGGRVFTSARNAPHSSSASSVSGGLRARSLQRSATRALSSFVFLAMSILFSRKVAQDLVDVCIDEHRALADVGVGIRLAEVDARVG